MSELYAVGDVHGCLESLKGLLAKLPPDARFIFMGDILNRGPQSLETLRLIRELALEGRARCLLGNHELHLLTVAAGHGHAHGRDTITPILEAPDREELIGWLRRQRMALFEDGTLYVHAGVHPSWDLETALALARECEDHLSGEGWKDYLRNMYGGDQWDPAQTGEARMRSIFNAFTRIRFVKEDGTLDFSVSEGIASALPGMIPWFRQEDRALRNQKIVFGHWSMLGLLIRPNLCCVDTGCLWGGALTAMRMSDGEIVMERAPEWCTPGKNKN